MKDLFKHLLNKTQCQKSGICSVNPIINAVEAVFLNEIRQIAFYMVKLNELNLSNREVLKETIMALSVSISDTNFNKSAVINFYRNIKNIKEKVKMFYSEQTKDSGIQYEFITPHFRENPENITSLIKGGENIIKEFYNTINEEKFRLIKTVILIAKTTALKIVELSEFKEVDCKYYYETLRLFSLANYKTTREEKFKRRIKEFSNIIYDIQKELNFELTKSFGKRTGGIIKTDVFKGHSIFVLGGDIKEFHNLLQQTKNEDINIYINPSLLSVVFYPEFQKFPNFKGLFGTNELEIDFSKFKGAIYITKNSTQVLDLAFRGSIFTTKIIPYDKAVKIEENNLTPLIEETKKLAGFDEFTKGDIISFEYDIEKIQNFLDRNKDKNILLSFGDLENKIKEKFLNYEIINFQYPYETEGLYYILENTELKNLSIYFSECSKETITNIISIIDKKISNIFISNCTTSDINPHIINSLYKDFNVIAV